MKKVNLILATLVFTLASCQQSKNIDPNKVTHISNENIPPLQQVDFEVIDLPEEECMNSTFFVYQDTILIIRPSMGHGEYNMIVMNMNTKKIICKYLKRGNGPGEVLFCDFDLRQNRFVANDILAKRLIVFNLDSLLIKKQEYVPQVYQTRLDFISADKLSDTSFVFLNGWYMDGCGVKENENTQELLVSGMNCDKDYEIPQNAAPIMGDISGSSVLTNIEKQKVFITYSYKPQFTLLNSNLDTLKVIYGPDPFIKQKYKRDAVGIISKTCSYYVFGPVISTDSHIFACSSRLQNIPKTKIREVEMQDEIYKFDWDGNMVGRYQMSKKMFFFCAAGYSEKTNIFYFCAKDENDEVHLCKAQL